MTEAYLEALTGHKVDVAARSELLDLYLQANGLDREEFSDEQIEQWTGYISKIDASKPTPQGLAILYALAKHRRANGLDTRTALAYFTECLGDHLLADEATDDEQIFPSRT
jgi:hypothetical protein